MTSYIDLLGKGRRDVGKAFKKVLLIIVGLSYNDQETTLKKFLKHFLIF